MKLDNSALLLSPTNYQKAVSLQDTHPDDVCPGCTQTINNTFRFRVMHDQSRLANSHTIRCSWTLDHLAARNLTRQMIQHTNNQQATA
jgi:predicted Fe-S protein YdhL (DUF1289 family)